MLYWNFSTITIIIWSNGKKNYFCKQTKERNVTDKDNIYLSIIIPIYNEEANLKQMFDLLFSVEFPQFVKKIEYIAVNDFLQIALYKSLKK